VHKIAQPANNICRCIIPNDSRAIGQLKAILILLKLQISDKLAAGVFNNTYSTKDQVKSNLINLLLTDKGERVIDGNYQLTEQGS
jgi:hypothetical protein